MSSKLGYTEVRLGRREGIPRLREATQSAPEVLEIRERLMKALICMNSLPDAASEAEQLARLEGTAKAYLRAASIRVHARQLEQAKEILNRGIAAFPDSNELRMALTELCESTESSDGDARADQSTGSSLPGPGLSGRLRQNRVVAELSGAALGSGLSKQVINRGAGNSQDLRCLRFIAPNSFQHALRMPFL